MESPRNGDADGGPACYPLVLLDAARTGVFSRLKRVSRVGVFRMTGPHDNFLIWPFWSRSVPVLRGLGEMGDTRAGS